MTEKRKRTEKQTTEMPAVKKRKINPSGLQTLPYELVVNIFSFSNSEEYAKYMQVSKSTNQAVRADYDHRWIKKKIQTENCLKELGYSVSKQKDIYSAYVDNLQRLTTILEGILIEFKNNPEKAELSISESKKNVLKLLKTFNQPTLGKNNQNTMQEAIYSTALIQNLINANKENIELITANCFTIPLDGPVEFLAEKKNLLDILCLCGAKEAYARLKKNPQTKRSWCFISDYTALTHYLLKNDAYPYLSRFADMCAHLISNIADTSRRDTCINNTFYELENLFTIKNLYMLTWGMHLTYREVFTEYKLINNNTRSANMVAVMEYEASKYTYTYTCNLI